MSLTKQKTMKKGGGDGPGDIMLRGAMGATGMAMDEYVEKPRPSLYNVIKKLKEQTNETFNRLCYIAKVNENVYKGDFANEMKTWTTGICT